MSLTHQGRQYRALTRSSVPQRLGASSAAATGRLHVRRPGHDCISQHMGTCIEGPLACIQFRNRGTAKARRPEVPDGNIYPSRSAPTCLEPLHIPHVSCKLGLSPSAISPKPWPGIPPCPKPPSFTRPFCMSTCLFLQAPARDGRSNLAKRLLDLVRAVWLRCAVI